MFMDFMDSLLLALLFFAVAIVVSSAVLGADVILIGLASIAQVGATALCLCSLVFCRR